MRSILCTLILALAGVAQTAPQSTDFNALVDAVDRTYAAMKDFSAEFVQISTNSVNQRQQDDGLLYLTRDRKMRWEYQNPEARYYISNGKTLFFYNPINRQVNQEPVKDSLAERIPIMFLVGRSGLRKEFKEITELKKAPLVDGDRVMELSPNRKFEDIQKIEIEVNPVTHYIVRMVVTTADKSTNEVIFRNIAVNTNIPASTFEFIPPPGVRVVQGVSIQ